MRNHIILFVLAAGSGVASANAFVVNEHDAKATGRSNAMAASDTDPSAIFYNPAGIAVQEGTGVSIGGTLVLAHGGFKDTSDVKTSTNNSPAVLPQFFITSRVHELVAVGLGFYTPFGLQLKWPSDSLQSTVATEETLRTFFISPVIGFNLNKYVPGLSIGGGVDIVPATVQLKRNIFFGEVQGNANLGATATGVGGRVGVMYRPEPLPALSVGAMWRSQVKEKFSGTGDFNVDDPTFRPALPEDGPVTTTVTLPQQVNFGVSYHVIPDLELEADVQWMGWSSIKSQDINATGAGDVPIVISSPRNYSDTFTPRFGIEYKLHQYDAAVRAGYTFDPTPIPATIVGPDLPDVDRHVVSLGGSKLFGDYGLHVGFLWVLPATRDTSSTLNMPPFKGTYDVQAFVASVSFAGRFGATVAPAKEPATTETARR